MHLHPTSRRLLALILILGAAALTVIAVLQITGSRAYIMQTGSMTPTMPTGSLVISKPVPLDTLEVGDVIAHQRTEDGIVRVHRIIEKDTTDTGTSLTTAGDVTGEIDLTPASEDSLYVGKIIYSSHAAGAVWKMMPYFAAGLIASFLFSLVISSAALTSFVSGAFIAAALIVGGWKTGTLVSVEELSTEQYVGVVMSKAVQTGAIPIDIMVEGGDTVRAAPGEIVTLAAPEGAEELKITMKAVWGWQTILLLLIPTLVNMYLRVPLPRFRRKKAESAETAP